MFRPLSTTPTSTGSTNVTGFGSQAPTSFSVPAEPNFANAAAGPAFTHAMPSPSPGTTPMMGGLPFSAPHVESTAPPSPSGIVADNSAQVPGSVGHVPLGASGAAVSRHQSPFVSAAGHTSSGHAESFRGSSASAALPGGGSQHEPMRTASVASAGGGGGGPLQRLLQRLERDSLDGGRSGAVARAAVLGAADGTGRQDGPASSNHSVQSQYAMNPQPPPVVAATGVAPVAVTPPPAARGVGSATSHFDGEGGGDALLRSIDRILERRPKESSSSASGVPTRIAPGTSSFFPQNQGMVDAGASAPPVPDAIRALPQQHRVAAASSGGAPAAAMHLWPSHDGTTGHQSLNGSSRGAAQHLHRQDADQSGLPVNSSSGAYDTSRLSGDGTAGLVHSMHRNDPYASGFTRTGGNNDGAWRNAGVAAAFATAAAGVAAHRDHATGANAGAVTSGRAAAFSSAPHFLPPSSSVQSMPPPSAIPSSARLYTGPAGYGALMPMPSAPTAASGIAAGNAAAAEELARRVHELDQKLLYIERREQEAWALAGQQLTQLAEQSQAGAGAIAAGEVKLSKDLQRLEDVITKEMAVESQRRSETEATIRGLIETATAEVRNAIGQVEHTRFTALDRRMEEVARASSDLATGIERRLAAVSGETQEAAARALDEAQRIEGLLVQRRREQEEADVKLLNLLEETCVSLHQQLATERAEREESHRRLEKLLVDVAQRQATVGRGSRS